MRFRCAHCLKDLGVTENDANCPDHDEGVVEEYDESTND